MKHQSPPKRTTEFLEWICPDYLFEGIIGDLEEQFYIDVEQCGIRKARRRFHWNAVRFMHPEIILRNKFQYHIIHNIMLANYLKTAGRNMAKRKFFSFINAFGLSIGIAFCMLIYLFIEDEKSFDQFHENKDRIFRMESKMLDLWNPESKDTYNYHGHLQTPIAGVLKEEVPQVEYVTRIDQNQAIVSANDKVFREDIIYTDPDFFQMFSFPVVAGNRNELLTDKHHVVITEEIAEKYFGTTDALGKSLKIEYIEANEFIVVGIIKSAPANSTIDYKILISQENRPFYEKNMNRWLSFNTSTYVQLVKNADMDQFDQNLAGIVKKYMGEMEKWRDTYSLPEDVLLFKYQYSSLPDVHLNTQVTANKSSDPQYSLILTGIAILIIIIACINYISLSLTSSASRRTEVGIRKAIGANRKQLISQFSVESILLAVISMLFGILLMFLFLPAFNDFTNKEIIVHSPVILKIGGIGMALAVFVGLISGLYPSFFLSAFKPTQVLKGGFTKLKAGFTKPLVVLQFSLSAFLIISSVIMYNQMEYVTSLDLGYEKDHVLVIPTQIKNNESSNQVVARMRHKLLQEPDVLNISGTTLALSRGSNIYGYTIEGENHYAFVYGVDPYYVETLNIKLKEGRNFSPEIASDTNAVIVNESLVADMGWENPLEEHLNWKEDSTGPGAKVIGVVENYHFQSLEANIEPMFLSMDTEGMGYLENMMIKLKSNNISSSVSKIEKIFHEIAPNKPFEYRFLDEDIAQQYASHERWMNIMGLSTLFAILISCLGLFGLAGINAVNRTKEIGIRKVFGAELANIFVLLNRQYVYLALISFLIAIPASWYVMDKWLKEFQYSISMTWEIFAISMIAGFAIAILTVSYHAIKAALINPAKTLKCE